MAILTDYSIVRMGARASMLQPASAAPALCDTEQVILLLCLPLAGGNRTNSEAHSSLPVCNFEGPCANVSNTIVQPEMTKREQRGLAHGRSLTCNTQDGGRQDSLSRAAGRLQSALLAPYGRPCIS